MPVFGEREREGGGGYITGSKLFFLAFLTSSHTSSSSQNLRPDDPVVGKSYDSSYNTSHTVKTYPKSRASKLK